MLQVVQQQYTTGPRQDYVGAKLMHVFSEYCSGQTTMDGKSFAKLAKDTKILDKRLTITDVDLTFAKVKAKADRRISFDQFMYGLELLAEKK